MEKTCRICGNNSNNIDHTSREMMYGTFEKFHYIECANCGCIQINKYLKDISKHYPNNYYSFAIPHKDESYLRSLKRKIRGHLHYHKNKIVKSLTKILKSPRLNIGILNASINMDSRILDVGCGAGELLFKLRSHGFKNLTGVDPYIDKDINIMGIKIFKKEIYDVKDKYDLVMLNHSFEHMENPQKILSHLQTLIKNNGQILIRIPIASSYAWKHYGVNWVQLDPPRHYYLHTTKSIDIITRQSNLTVEKIIYDSESFQFLGSELYKRDIPMPLDSKDLPSTINSIFTKKQIKNFSILAKELNEKKQGDQACFYLAKA